MAGQRRISGGTQRFTVRGAAQAHLINEDWVKIKAVLSNQAVDTAEKFDTAIFKLTPEDTPQIYDIR
jgi:hypothetical protein